jgi:hypothetical protein
MVAIFINSVYWFVVGVVVWGLLQFNYLPSVPNWTLPVIAVMVSLIPAGIKELAKYKEQTMKQEILNAILASEGRLADKISLLSERVAKLEGKLEGKSLTLVSK